MLNRAGPDGVCRKPGDERSELRHRRRSALRVLLASRFLSANVDRQIGSGSQQVFNSSVADCDVAETKSEKRPIAERWRWIGLAAAISEMGAVSLAYRGEHTRMGDGTIDGGGVVIEGFLVFVLPFAAASLLALRNRRVSPWVVVVIAVGAGALFATVRPGNLEALWFVYALFAAVLLLGLVSAAGRLELYAKRAR